MKNTHTHSESGSIGLWTILILALFTILITVTMLGGPRQKENDSFLLWALLVTGVVTAQWSLIALARKNRYAVCMFLLPVSFLGLLISGVTVYAGTGPKTKPILFLVLFAVVGVAALAFIIWSQLRKETVPNILRQQFKAGDIYEIDGVQLVPIQTQQEIAAGDALPIHFALQNCWDSERTVTLSLKTTMLYVKKREVFAFPREMEVTLRPCEVGSLTIPVVSNTHAHGKYTIRASATITGTGGTRVRHWRAQGVSTVISPLMSVALMTVGLLLWGGGLQFPVKIRKSLLPDYLTPQDDNAPMENNLPCSYEEMGM
ncbi:MAG: hypothetical protein GY755_23245 [Chloroflexi bacterium]|nr:hypothetical protein [Chloroflexota bacterium]